MNERTHASFFSGVGGLDLGLERAGWRTVSFSEIDPYASAVLAERWPGVPNLGSITELAGVDGAPRSLVAEGRRDGPPYRDATLWSGGFPCQDLSIAGKRRGLVGSRSGLAFAFLGLVERHRPPWVLLENVPGLLNSHRGRDFASLLGRLSELGYGVGWRVLDARYYGVAQRRRRVFILASRDPGGRAGADSAAEVLSLAASGGGHPAAGGEAGAGTTRGADDGAVLARSVTTHHRGFRQGWNSTLIPSSPADDARGQGRRREGSADLGEREPHAGHVTDADAIRRPAGASPDAGRDGAPDGLAGRLDDRQVVVNALDQRRGGADDNEAQAGHLVGGQRGDDDPLLPLGLDSHRYRCCGNGVVSNVAEAIGRALLAVMEREAAA